MASPRLQPFAAPAFAVDRGESDANVVTLPFPGYRQVRNYTCGYVSALMMLRYFGRGLGGTELMTALNTTRDGTSQGALIRVLRSEGIRVGVHYDVTFASLQGYIDQGKPAVVYLHDEEHWLCVYGYGEKPDRIFVADPQPLKKCEQPWQEYGDRLNGFAMVCSVKQNHPIDEKQIRPSVGTQLAFSFR